MLGKKYMYYSVSYFPFIFQTLSNIQIYRCYNIKVLSIKCDIFLFELNILIPKIKFHNIFWVIRFNIYYFNVL